MKAAVDELAEVGAVAKGGDDRGLGEGFCGVGDAEIESKERDEALDNNLVGLKATKQLLARQLRRGVMEAGGGGAEPERKEKPTKNSAEAWRKRKLGFFLYALRARGRKRGQCRPRRRGWHLHGSPVRAQNLLMVKVSLTTG